MSGIATAIGASALISAGASIASTSMASDATQSAADTAAGAQDRATAEQGRQFDTTQRNFAPYKAIGENAAPKFTDFVNNGGGNITGDPLYQNNLKAATRLATQRTAGSGQSTTGGAAQTRLQQLGDQIFNNTYQTKYQQLTDAMKVGQGAAGSISQAGQVLGNQAQVGAINQGNIATNNANTQAGLYGGLSTNLSSLATGAAGRLNGSSGNWWGSDSGTSNITNTATGEVISNTPTVTWE